jgi:hypothetical protein
MLLDLIDMNLVLSGESIVVPFFCVFCFR